jgi:YHS domain-containing protein
VTRLVLVAVLLLAVAWAFWRLVDGVIEAFGGAPGKRARTRPRAAAVKLVRDPVCGTWVSPNDARVLRIGSATHYFCSDQCRVTFQKKS